MTAADHHTATEIDAAQKLVKDREVRNALLRAIDAVIIPNHGLAHRLGDDRPPYTATLADGLARYGTTEIFDLWQTWRAVEQLRVAADAWEQHTADVAPNKQGMPA